MGTVGQYPELPFTGSITVSRTCSYEGAKAAQPRAGSQAWRLFFAYRDHGPLTDHEAHAVTRLPLATICARRKWLRDQRLVKDFGAVPGPYGSPNTRWGLTWRGEHMTEEIRSDAEETPESTKDAPVAPEGDPPTTEPPAPTPNGD